MEQKADVCPDFSLVKQGCGRDGSGSQAASPMVRVAVGTKLSPVRQSPINLQPAGVCW